MIRRLTTDNPLRRARCMLDSRALFILALAAALALGACSDDDAPLPDKGPVADAGPDVKLWPCTTPGQSCNAHDDCAINPVCGDDLLCHPQGHQDCDDGLDCTDDLCAGMGVCDNVPKAEKCALRVKTDKGTEIRCFEKEASHPDDPCMMCDPERDPLDWSGRNGGACDDGNPCTKEDYCQDGKCGGTDFSEKCSDGLSCTDDMCDGKGECGTPKLNTNSCLIDGVCYTDGEQDSTGCNVCDPTKPNEWTPLGPHCLIDGQCYKPGEEDSIKCSVCDTSKPNEWTPLTGKCKIGGVCYNKSEQHPGKCAECDPDVNATAWTVIGSTFCLIDDTCKNPGEQDDIGCAECKPSASKYAWTPLSGKCKIAGKCYDNNATHTSGCLVCNYSADPNNWSPVAGATKSVETFDGITPPGLPGGWSETHTDPAGAIKWQVAVPTNGAVSGSNALYYGNPATKDYDNNDINGGTLTLKSIALPAGKKAALVFKVWLDVEDLSGYDEVDVNVNGSSVWNKDLVDWLDYETWVEQIVDLSSYQGQTITITITFDTVDDTINDTEGVFFDDWAIFTGC